MLFLLFACMQAFQLRKICNYYRGAPVLVQSRTGDSGDFVDVMTVPATDCVEQTVETSDMQFKLKATIDGSELDGLLHFNSVPSDTCANEAVAFIIPDDGNDPTADLTYGADGCTDTDIFVHNYCTGSGTVSVTMVDSVTSESETGTIAYSESVATTDVEKPSDNDATVVYTFTGPTITTSIAQTVSGSDLVNSGSKAIHLFIYGDNGDCRPARVEHTVSSSAALITFLTVALAMLQF